MSKSRTIRSKLTALERKSFQLELIQEVTQLMAANEKTEDIFMSTLYQLVEQFGYQAVQVYQLAAAGKDLWLYLELGSGTKPITSNEDIFSVEELNIVSDAVRKAEIIFIPEITKGPYSYQGEVDTDLGPELALPLPYEAKVLGVLRIQGHPSTVFDQTDIDFLANLARLLATVIRNNRQLKQLEDSIQEIRTLYAVQLQDSLQQQRTTDQSQAIGYEYDNLDTIPINQSEPLNFSNQTGITRQHKNGKKELVAPIQLHGETIGVLGLESLATDDDWASDDVSLLEEVSSQVALAIENARLLQQTQAQTHELSVLFEATRQLTETIDLDQIYKILAVQIGEFFNADKCTILLLSTAHTYFESSVVLVRDSQNQLVRITDQRLLEVGKSPSLQAILKQPIVTIHHQDDENLEQALLDYMSPSNGNIVHSLVRLPLVVRNQAIAMVEVEHLSQRKEYSHNELQLAQAIIAQVTVAVENAQHFQQTQLTLAETQKLYEVSRQLVESTNVEDVFDMVIETVKSYGIDRVSLSLLDRSHAGEIDSVTIVASWDRDSDKALPIGTSFSADNFSLVHTFAQPPFTPLISHDLRQVEGQDERMDGEFRIFAVEQLGAITSFSAPMFLGSEYKGVLSIYTRKPHTYTNHQIRVFQTLADQAIIAIENYRLLEATRQERDRASLLYELGQHLSHTTTVDDVQQAFLAIISQVGATDGEIYITDGGEFASMASSIAQRKEMQPHKLAEIAVSEGYQAEALTQQQLIVKNLIDTPESEWRLHGVEGLDTFQTYVCVPFYSQRSTLQGVLSFFHNQENGFTNDQLATLTSVTRQTAATLENVWLLHQTNAVLSETELLYNITREFNSAQSIEELLRVMAKNLAGLRIDFMAIGLNDALSNDNIPQQIKLMANWHKGAADVSIPDLTLTLEDYAFLQHLRPNTATEIFYDRQDATTQSYIDNQLEMVRTILAVPLVAGTDWLGVLFLASKHNSYIFKVNFVNQLSTLASQAAVVIQNLQLVKETRQTLFNSETLSELGTQLLKADGATAIYDFALEAIAKTEPDRGASIFMYDQIEGSVDLELVAVWDNPSQQWPTIPVGSRLSAEDLGLAPLLRTGLTVLSSDATVDERFSPMLRQLLTMMQIQVLVAIPLWLDKEVEGFMLIGNQSNTEFSPDIVRLYEDVARETSGALENRRLFDAAQYQAWQLQTAAEVSQAATSYLDLDTLLSEAVELIKRRFDFYHASIFLVDEYQRYAIVKASTGEIGQEMLAMNHKLEVGGKSIVGTATESAQPRIALDVGTEAVHFNNPLLPLTRSEMALPLIVQGRVIGALDVQSTKQGAFRESDVTILQSMSNQLANAIAAARAVQEANSALDEVSKLHQHYLMDQWQGYLSSKNKTLHYQLTEDGVIQQEQDIPLRNFHQLVEGKQPLILTEAELNNGSEEAAVEVFDKSAKNTPKRSHLVAPITLNQRAIIGTLDFELPEQTDEDWDDDLLSIVEAVTNQAAQAIEAARLYEQSQTAREEAEALYEVGRTIITTENELDMFNTVLGKLLSTLGLTQGGILFFNDDRQSGRLYALFQDGQPVTKPQLEFPIADNASYQELIQTKQPVAIEDMATDQRVAKIREQGLVGNIASLLLVPIIINDEVIGAVGADAVNVRHHFTEQEMNLAMAMANQLSIALQNRRLIEETTRRAVLLQTSSDVSRVATSILEEDSMMDQVVDLIKERFGFYHVQIFLIDSAGQYAVLHKSTGDTGEQLLNLNHKVAIGSQSIIGQAIYKREAMVVRIMETGDETPQPRNEFLPDTQAELAIPLQVGDTLIGAIDVHSTRANVFTEEEISTLETLTAQLAVAIQNARAFKEQQETAQRLQEIDKLKTQFLANMSHELRTPLNSIIGFSRVILKGIDGPLTELQKADLTSIHHSGQHLLGLINNILDLSKIEAGKMELNFEETEVEPIVKTVMATAIALIKDKPVELHQEIPDEIPTIWADPTRIRQVILNLVSNACKFTEEGSVITRVAVNDDYVTFSVTDTGIGIPESQLHQVFEEFTQVDASTTRKVGGTGLGLPISRYFVEMHQGKIWVESSPGQGATFKFTIPISPPENNDAPEFNNFIEASDSEGRKRLVVAIDDDPTVITLYKRFLEKQNYEIVGLDHGKNAVSKVKALAPYAILLDIVIPDKDGWNVIKELKEDPFTKNIPVIICSIVSDKNRGFSLGASNYLIKPIAEAELIEALKQIDNLEKDDVKVLVVDDQADDILLIRRILEAQANYTIFEANNGKAGLDLVQKVSPDLIVLDLNMPEMDGFAMLEVLKSSEHTRGIPIIIVSAHDLTQEEQHRLTGQVEVLLHKGLFTENELLEDVSQALERIRPEEKMMF